MTAHSIGEEIFYATILGLPLLHVFLLNNTSAEHFATVANSAATQSVML